jgi:hypothetical protein
VNFAEEGEAMQIIRFFEDREGDPNVNDGRRLLLGHMITEGPMDGGAREAVRVATTEDVAQYPAAYAAYLEPPEEGEPPAAPPLGGDQQPLPLQGEVPPAPEANQPPPAS